METEIDKAFQRGNDYMSESCNRAVRERTDAYNAKLKEIEQLQVKCDALEISRNAATEAIVMLRAENKRLKKNLQHIVTCLMIMKNTKSEEGIRDLPKLAEKLQEDVEQALKGR